MLGETFRGETVRRTKNDDFQDEKYGCLNAVSFRISFSAGCAGAERALVLTQMTGKDEEEPKSFF